MFGDPYFSFQKQVLFTIISTLSKTSTKHEQNMKQNMNKTLMWEVIKKFKISVLGTWKPAILRLQGA